MELEFNILGNSDCSKPLDIALEKAVLSTLLDVNFINFNITKTSLSLTKV